VFSEAEGMTSPLESLLNMFRPETIQSALYAAGIKMGVVAEKQVSPYPPQSHAPLPKKYLRSSIVDGELFYSKFESQRHQGKVFSLIAAGVIPYRRTGQLGRSITSDVTGVSPVDVTVSIGTNTDYAPLVIGDPETQQSPYHRGVTTQGMDFKTRTAGAYQMGAWTPLQVDMERGQEVIQAAGIDALIAALTKEL
jgi:hypothetical protein